MRWIILFALALVPAACVQPPKATSPLVVWAWERPEDLRFADGQAEIAVQSGFVSLEGSIVAARGRRYPLIVQAAPSTALVHVQIEHDRPLAWTPLLRRQTSAAVLHYATRIPAARVQIDFEVRASERQVLLDVLQDVRRGLPRKIFLSMTALASWCDRERWLDRAPVDEIVPMLFRMQRGDEAIRGRLAAGHDFRHPRCRSALGIAVDTPVPRAPSGRRVYLFDRHSWTAGDFGKVKREVEGWR